MNRLIILLCASLALTGCVGGPGAFSLPESHPASPEAQMAAQPMATPTLMPGAQGLLIPLTTNQAAMQHEHHAQPTGKDGPQHAEHDHEGQPPKKQEEPK